MEPSKTNFSKLLDSFKFVPNADSNRSTRPSPSTELKRKRELEGTPRSPNKRLKQDISKLPPLQDRLQKDLDVIVCGCNPGYTSALMGFHYEGNTQNAFWRCLHQSGLTPRLLSPDQGPSLPKQYSIGLTDLVVRPSHAFSDIPSKERRDSVLVLLRRIAYYRPRILALNSFTIWSDIASQLAKKDGLPGISFKVPSSLPRPALKLPQLEKNREPCFIPWKIVHKLDPNSEGQVTETLIIPLPGTSGANASYSLTEKVAFFKAIHDALPLIKQGTFDTSHMGQIVIQAPQMFKEEGKDRIDNIISPSV